VQLPEYLRHQPVRRLLRVAPFRQLTNEQMENINR
jgi:hypothetical protein